MSWINIILPVIILGLTAWVIVSQVQSLRQGKGNCAGCKGCGSEGTCRGSQQTVPEKK